MSQTRRQLNLIAYESGLPGRILRPLSARLLQQTDAERAGLVDREQLYAFSGRSRRGLHQLARRLGLDDIPQPSPGCPLATASFAPRVFDLLQYAAEPTRWDFELLAVGRHQRLDSGAKLVVGRNEAENARLADFFARGDAAPAAMLEPDGFAGPTVLLVGRIDQPTLEAAAATLLGYAKPHRHAAAQIVVRHHGQQPASTILPVLPGQ